MEVWEFIYSKLAASVSTMLLYVLKSEGSSPGRQGFTMAVSADGEMAGSIGGGIMEHKFVEMARAALGRQKSDKEIYRQVHDKKEAVDQSGMICSGEQTIFLYQLQPTDLDPIRALIASSQKNKNGTLQLSRKGILFSDSVPAQNYILEETADDFLLQEKTGPKNHLHIIGGGHCSLALSKLMAALDFFITVYEEREGLNTMEQNEFAHRKMIIPSYALVGESIQSGDDVYVVIMTFGYRTDDQAFRSLIGKQFKYLGVLGSSKKMEKLFEQYREDGLDQSLLASVHTPIGLQIKSKTPAEIAVSIAAQIIEQKNKDQ